MTERHESIVDDPRSEDKEVSKSPPILEGDLHVVKKILGYKEITCGEVLSKTIVALGLSDGTIELWDCKKATRMKVLSSDRNEDPKLPVTRMTCFRTTDGDYVPVLCVSYASGYTSLWNLSTDAIAWEVKEDRQALANCVSPDLETFAVGGSDAKITLYDMESRKCVRTLEFSADEDIMDGHTMRIFALKYHPDRPNEMVSGGWDNSVQFWDTRKPHSIRKIYGPHICGDTIEFLKGGKELLTASWAKDNALQIWDYKSGNLIQDLFPDSFVSYSNCCTYCPNGNFILVGGGNNNLLRIVDETTKTTVASYRNLPDAVNFAKALPQLSQRELHHQFCVGFGQSLYVMQVKL